MFHKDIGRWANTMLEHGTDFNEDYTSALEDLEHVADKLNSHGSGCHNNPEWDCACEEPTATEFAYAIFDHLLSIGDRGKQSVMSQVLINYLEHRDQESSEWFFAHQEVARQLDEALHRITEMEKPNA